MWREGKRGVWTAGSWMHTAAVGMEVSQGASPRSDFVTAWSWSTSDGILVRPVARYVHRDKDVGGQSGVHSEQAMQMVTR